jgi:hypothetical protein
MTRIAIFAALSLAAAACGGGASPTAPSAVATGAVTVPAVPAPPTSTTAAAASVTGSWSQNGTPMMTLTQAGNSILGTLVPVTVDFGGIVSVFTGNITGSAAGANITLAFQNTVTGKAGTEALICKGADSFSGQLDGNALSGTFISGTTPYVCAGGMPLPSPQVSGPMIFMRQ